MIPMFLRPTRPQGLPRGPLTQGKAIIRKNTPRRRCAQAVAEFTRGAVMTAKLRQELFVLTLPCSSFLPHFTGVSQASKHPTVYVSVLSMCT